MKISINIITRNRKFELERAIKSCIKHKIKDMEIVIVDNGSSDGSKTHIISILEFDKVNYNYYYSETNLGVAGARNKALKLSKGDYIFTLDDDAIIETDDIFNKVIVLMNNNEQIVAAALNIYEPESKKYLIGKTYSVKNNKDNNEMRAFSFIGAAHILRKNFFEKKMYPENLMFGSEELYASLLIHKKDKILAYFEDIKVLHLPSKILRVDGDKRKLDFIMNIYIIKKLFYPRLLHPLLTFIFIIRIVRHRLYNFISWVDICKTYKIRYSPKDVNRISFKDFISLVRKVGILYLL